jgi:hypothetical protein
MYTTPDTSCIEEFFENDINLEVSLFEQDEVSHTEQQDLPATSDWLQLELGVPQDSFSYLSLQNIMFIMQQQFPDPLPFTQPISYSHVPQYPAVTIKEVESILSSLLEPSSATPAVFQGSFGITPQNSVKVHSNKQAESKCPYITLNWFKAHKLRDETVCAVLDCTYCADKRKGLVYGKTDKMFMERACCEARHEFNCYAVKACPKEGIAGVSHDYCPIGGCMAKILRTCQECGHEAGVKAKVKRMYQSLLLFTMIDKKGCKFEKKKVQKDKTKPSELSKKRKLPHNDTEQPAKRSRHVMYHYESI